MTRRRWVYRDGQSHEVEIGYVPPPRVVHVVRDIKPYRSMIDGSIIPSRSRHREHLRDHNCVEVGNDRRVLNAKREPLRSPPGLKQLYIDVANSKLRSK